MDSIGLPSFELLTTIKYDHQQKTIPLLKYHLNRLKKTHEELSIKLPNSWCSKEDACSSEIIENEIKSKANGNLSLRIRLTIGPNHHIQIVSSPLPQLPISHDGTLPIIVIDNQSTKYNNNPFLLYKTTNRTIYDNIRRRHNINSNNDNILKPFDVLMYNEFNQITETTISNIGLRTKGSINEPFITPKSSCGLLPGIQRDILLKDGVIIEGIITLHQLVSEDWEMICFNALRGLYHVQLLIK
ncbi:hypothetical protein CROQUDRAFT_719963 [Cronartium quercuum f. sp. fusiforme G11]|uniref:Uncharacterized protein n=1 Tax=Cronartium quercuum f. sp. fusiforme G11 TaxID=708437 RepID=A0A9P6NXA2_9BASI|nr:hypothetical protein CROQUDRAFT_719963 [Cronartium quercuum f. sp. fusiforme G11]